MLTLLQTFIHSSFAPYLDFGFMGCMIFSFVVYFVLSLLYTKAVKNRNMTYSVARNTAILGFIYWITLNSFYFCPVMFVFAPTGLISVNLFLDFICVLI